MFCCFYDIIAKVIAAQRFPALALLALGRKCHEMCVYVTFCEICEDCITLLLSATPHSITSSARPISVLGTLMPSALAAFRLMMSSTLVASWIGRSAGLSPLRIRPV